MENKNQTTPEAKRNDGVLPLDFNRAADQSKFPGGPVPDSAEVARMIRERALAVPERKAEQTVAMPETPVAASPEVIPAESPKTAIAESNLIQKAVSAAAANVAIPATEEVSGAEIEIPESETATSWLIKRKKKSAPMKFAESASLGKILQDARVSAGLTVKDVEAETRIRSSYLEALEQDRFGELPPPVYVRAYLRNLSNLFNLDKKMLEELLQLHYGDRQSTSISEEIYHKLEKDKQTNLEDENRIKRMILLVAVGCTALLILIIGSIFFMVSSSRASKVKTPAQAAVTPPGNGAAAATTAAADPKAFSPEKIEQLTVNQELDMEMLPVREEVKASSRAKPVTSRTKRQ